VPRAAGIGALLGMPAFLRLWTLGCFSGAMRQFETLAAALFVFDVTGSGLAVAIVTAARSLPMLLLGALAGVFSEAVDRRAILIVAQVVSALASLSVATVALSGGAAPWQIAVAALVSGTVWSTDMATRRRMLGEAVETPLIARGLALDSATGSMMRMLGPLLAGVMYQGFGLAGCFLFSTGCYLVAGALAAGVRHSQATRRLVLARVPAELAEGLAFARGSPVIAGVLGVTMAMNFFGFCYVALVAPIGEQHFGVTPALVGILAAAEPCGALLGGLLLTAVDTRLSGRLMMVGGTALFTVAEILMPLSPWFGLACLVLFLGGFGTAGFSNMQTALIITHAPAPIRSRLMGLLTVCIGMGPLGIVTVGLLAAGSDSRAALVVMGALGLASVLTVGARWRRAEAPLPAPAVPSPKPARRIVPE
jgi:MFS family permease